MNTSNKKQEGLLVNILVLKNETFREIHHNKDILTPKYYEISKLIFDFINKAINAEYSQANIFNRTEELKIALAALKNLSYINKSIEIGDTSIIIVNFRDLFTDYKHWLNKLNNINLIRYKKNISKNNELIQYLKEANINYKHIKLSNGKIIDFSNSLNNETSEIIVNIYTGEQLGELYIKAGNFYIIPYIYSKDEISEKNNTIDLEKKQLEADILIELKQRVKYIANRYNQRAKIKAKKRYF